MELDVARLVDTMDVAETCSYGEVGADLLECGVNVVDVFRLSVK